MTKIVQLHRMASSPAAQYVGPQGEIIGDLGANSLRFQDGATPGGFLLMQGANNGAEFTNPGQVLVNIGGAPKVSPAFTGTATTNGNDILDTSFLGSGVLSLLAGTSSGTGGIAGTTSPTFVTPILGAASATSLSIDGASLPSGTSFSTNGNAVIGGNTTINGILAVTGSGESTFDSLLAEGAGGGAFNAIGFGLAMGLNIDGVYANTSQGVLVKCIANGAIMNNGATSFVAASSRDYKKNHEDITDPIKAIKQYIAGLGHYNEDADDAPKRPFLYYEDAVNAFSAATHFRPAQTLTQEREVQVDEEHFLDENGLLVKQPVMEMQTFTHEIAELKSLSLEQHVPLLMAGIQALIKYIEGRDHVSL